MLGRMDKTPRNTRGGRVGMPSKGGAYLLGLSPQISSCWLSGLNQKGCLGHRGRSRRWNLTKAASEQGWREGTVGLREDVTDSNIPGMSALNPHPPWLSSQRFDQRILVWEDLDGPVLLWTPSTPVFPLGFPVSPSYPLQVLGNKQSKAE